MKNFLNLREAYNNNRTGFARRPREDDEYHTPDPVTQTHKIAFNVSKDGAEKHSRTVTISNSTKSKAEAAATARAHLQKQGYKIHEEVQIDELKKSTLASYATKATKDLSTNAYLVGVTKSHAGGSDDEALQRRKNRREGLPKAIARLAKEEVQIDELKKSTLASYASKAADKAAMHAFGAGGQATRYGGEPVSKRPDSYGADRKKAVKRLRGVDKALSRLTKEETDVYAKSEENKRSADAAKKQGDMFAHHMHMADHHDNLAQWHSENGRHSVADTHHEKSEAHHEKAMALKESVGPMMAAGRQSDRNSSNDNERGLGSLAPSTAPKKPLSTLQQLKRKNAARKVKEEVQIDEAAGHTIEAHGIKGMKGTPWRKTFKSHEHLNDWAEKNDSVEVHGTRDLEGAKKKTNEETQIDELSKPLLGRYVKKSADKMADASYKVATKGLGDGERDKQIDKMFNRREGIGKAVKRLTKEDAQLDEIKMTAAMKLQTAFQREMDRAANARRAGEAVLKGHQYPAHIAVAKQNSVAAAPAKPTGAQKTFSAIRGK